jgi:hypothetical protein
MGADMKLTTPYGEVDVPKNWDRKSDSYLFKYLQERLEFYVGHHGKIPWSLQHEVNECMEDLGYTPAPATPKRKTLVDRGGYYSLE